MPSLDVIFAYVVGVLAALAVIGALAFAVVWEWCAIRRTLAGHRHQTSEASFWRDRAALTVPERRR
jgi:cyanate permease